MSAPKWLADEGRVEWRRVVRWLDELGLATDFDRTLLAVYCQAYARLVQLEREVDLHGVTFVTEKGYVCQRPEFTMAQRQAVLVKQLAAEFGMSPASRTRVRAAPPKANEQDAAKAKRFFGINAAG